MCKNKKNKILSVLLSLCLIIGAAFAITTDSDYLYNKISTGYTSVKVTNGTDTNDMYPSHKYEYNSYITNDGLKSEYICVSVIVPKYQDNEIFQYYYYDNNKELISGFNPKWTLIEAKTPLALALSNSDYNYNVYNLVYTEPIEVNDNTVNIFDIVECDFSFHSEVSYSCGIHIYGYGLQTDGLNISKITSNWNKYVHSNTELIDNSNTIVSFWNDNNLLEYNLVKSGEGLTIPSVPAGKLYFFDGQSYYSAGYTYTVSDTKSIRFEAVEANEDSPKGESIKYATLWLNGNKYVGKENDVMTFDENYIYSYDSIYNYCSRWDTNKFNEEKLTLAETINYGNDFVDNTITVTSDMLNKTYYLANQIKQVNLMFYSGTEYLSYIVNSGSNFIIPACINPDNNSWTSHSGITYKANDVIVITGNMPTVFNETQKEA